MPVRVVFHDEHELGRGDVLLEHCDVRADPLQIHHQPAHATTSRGTCSPIAQTISAAVSPVAAVHVGETVTHETGSEQDDLIARGHRKRPDIDHEHIHRHSPDDGSQLARDLDRHGVADAAHDALAVSACDQRHACVGHSPVGVPVRHAFAGAQRLGRDDDRRHTHHRVTA